MVLVTLYISCTHWLLTSHSSHNVALLPGSSRCRLNTVRRNCADVQLRVQRCTVCTVCTVGPVREISLYTPAPDPARTTGNTRTLTGLCPHCCSAGVGYENLVSNPKIILTFPTRLPQKSRAPGFEARKLAAQVGGEISDTIYLHLRPAVYVRNLDLKHKHLAKFCPSDWRWLDEWKSLTLKWSLYQLRRDLPCQKN